ncbi:hypothetical protein ACFWP5_43610 [Streptomyces sp. NPDC058469]|uniref:hypothetical protein n=1 Tax=Streptomyces sp. NPDC058469 TaxID=3346514 RepID=UPI003648E760
MLADLIDSSDRQTGEREAMLPFGALVGAISIARVVDDPDLFEQIMSNVAAPLRPFHREVAGHVAMNAVCPELVGRVPRSVGVVDIVLDQACGVPSALASRTTREA